ncbi:B12-binding domain-containing radical SAM protein, partial [Acidobacteria bacterium AH-259-D05]|nr:B12-binding domain-containing radical SAM protein [Acidobacteria bacterium AH-259-D05]
IMPNALLVYPEFPPSYWGYKFALEFVGKKSSMPALGLLTVAGMFPRDYQLKVVDMNVLPLTSADLNWADVVFTSTMIVQKDSLQQVVERCNRAGVPVVAGGPHPTSFCEDIWGVDYFILDEVEEVLPEFLQDLQNGTAKKIYRAPVRPDMTKTPLPRFDLINLSDYGSMALQFSRGCPFDCEFCDITKLFGRKPRTKSNEQVLAEFDLLYQLGWRGNLFLVDDNFIGNKREAMGLLPAIARWQKERNYPFALFTEASVNLVRLEPLMDAMIDAGFNNVFLGIETPNPEALLKTKKKQNTRKGEENYLLDAVRRIQQKGMEVMGGFILGLDGDREDVFDDQIQFIQEAGIPMAMVGLLTALKGTDLYHRLQREGRLIEESTGNNVSITLNFETEMNRQTLIEGYKRVLSTIYDPTLTHYFERCLTMLKYLKPTEHSVRRVGTTEIVAIARSIKRQLFSRQGPAYFRFLVKVLEDHPRMFPEAVRLAIMGYHFEKVTSQQIAIHDFTQYLEAELDAFRETVSVSTKAQSYGIDEIRAYVQDLFTRVHAHYEQIHKDFRYSVEDVLVSFQSAVERHLEQLPGPFPLET